MELIVTASMAAVFGGGALLIWKAGPFLDQASRRMGRKRKIKGRSPSLHQAPGTLETPKRLEEPEKP